MSRPSADAGVTMLTAAPSGKADPRSRSEPSTTTAMAAWASFGPMDAASWAPVVPSGTWRTEPSGRVRDIELGAVGVPVDIPPMIGSRPPPPQPWPPPPGRGGRRGRSAW